MNTILAIATAAVTALILNLALTPFIISLSHRKAWYDHVDKRKIHTGNMPHIGGVGIFVAFVLASVAGLVMLTQSGEPSAFRYRHLVLFFCIYCLVHLTGIIDDFLRLRARHKLLLQALAAAFLTFSGYSVVSIDLPWGGSFIQLGPLAYLVSIVWLAGASNAVNFVDGMDGLAGGISLVAAVFFTFIAVVQGHFVTAVVAASLSGAVLGFLVFNWPPARIFMGDSGALLLGFVIASLTLIESSGRISLLTLCIPVSLLLVPICDTLASVLRRFRRGVGFYTPDKQHTHHKLLELGLTTRQVLYIVYALSMIPALAVSSWALLPDKTWPFWAMVSAWFLVGTFFLILDRVYRRNRSA